MMGGRRKWPKNEVIFWPENDKGQNIEILGADGEREHGGDLTANNNRSKGGAT